MYLQGQHRRRRRGAAASVRQRARHRRQLRRLLGTAWRRGTRRGWRRRFVRCEFASNMANEEAGGGAICVEGGTVVLEQQTHLHGNTALDTINSIRLEQGGILTYKLPAPLGHYINSLGQPALDFEAGTYADYPPACSAGIFGDEATPEAQSSRYAPQMRKALKARATAHQVRRATCAQRAASCRSRRCRGDYLIEPLVCEQRRLRPLPRGRWCVGGRTGPTPCVQGTYSNESGARDRRTCEYCPPNSNTDGEQDGLADPSATQATLLLGKKATSHTRHAPLAPAAMRVARRWSTFRSSRVTGASSRRPTCAAAGQHRGPACRAAAAQTAGGHQPHWLQARHRGAILRAVRNEQSVDVLSDEMACLPCRAADNAAPLAAIGGIALVACLLCVCRSRRKRRASAKEQKVEGLRELLRSIQRRLMVKFKALFYQIVTKVGETFIVTYLSGSRSPRGLCLHQPRAYGLGLRWRA